MGVMPLYQALELAKERGLDLVEVAANTAPPVCRVLDYGKYKYEQTKKERKSRRGQRAGRLREIRLRPRISEHDLEAKVRLIKKLLDEGDKVKVRVTFRGREITHQEIGWKLLQRVTEAMKGIAVLEKPPAAEGRSIGLILSLVPAKRTEKLKAVTEA